jgi:hypothetical protein
MMAQDSPSDAIERIGVGIAKLKDKFPELRQFSVSQNVHSERWAIDYAYHTHTARNRAGWAGGVPNPDDDGVWFFIDFHRPDSQLQIDSQPVVPPYCLGDKLVMFLILEGKKTGPVGDAVWQVVEQQGVKYCPRGVGAPKFNPSDAIQGIGAEIAKFKDKFPQLRQFSVSQHVHSDRWTIEYDYHTHDPSHVDGVSVLVPEPDADGIWLYIDFHGPDSTLKIDDPNHVPFSCFGDQRVVILILEGKKTKSAHETVDYFLDHQGVKDCPEVSH